MIQKEFVQIAGVIVENGKIWMQSRGLNHTDKGCKNITFPTTFKVLSVNFLVMKSLKRPMKTQPHLII